MTTTIQVLPAILEKDPAEIQAKLDRVRPYCATVHLDVMDGEFVRNITVNDPAVIAKLNWGELKISLHLMINNPMLFLRRWALPQVELIVIHYETSNNLREEIQLIKQLGKQVAIAINPHTPTYAVKEYLNDIDAVLVMGVEPGFSTQAFNADVLQKITYLRELKPTLPIMVDGGVNGDTKNMIIKAGTTILCANSYIFKSANIEASINHLRSMTHE